MTTIYKQQEGLMTFVNWALLSYYFQSYYTEGSNKIRLGFGCESRAGARILWRGSSVRLSQHLEPSSTVGTKAQTERHLSGAPKQKPLLQVQASASPLPLPQLTDSLILRFEKLSLFFFFFLPAPSQANT